MYFPKRKAALRKDWTLSKIEGIDLGTVKIDTFCFFSGSSKRSKTTFVCLIGWFFTVFHHGIHHHQYYSKTTIWDIYCNIFQVIQAVPSLYPNVGGHLNFKRVTFSPSQKGHQQNCQELSFFPNKKSTKATPRNAEFASWKRKQHRRPWARKTVRHRKTKRVKYSPEGPERFAWHPMLRIPTWMSRWMFVKG